jgi:dTDP-glucose pyrophosphorylase
MPIGGIGKRLAEAGFKKPKPLIKVMSVPMFIRALYFLSEVKIPFSIHIIVNSNILDVREIQKVLNDYHIHASLYEISFYTKGSAETVSFIKEKLDMTAPTLIVDCDIEFHSPDFINHINSSLYNNEFDASVIYFESNDSKYSYVKFQDNSSLATEIVEKEVISNNAIIGAYFFSKFELFEKGFTLLKMRNLNNGEEYYISRVLNSLITKGYRVFGFEGVMKNYGTYDELKKYIHE